MTKGRIIFAALLVLTVWRLVFAQVGTEFVLRWQPPAPDQHPELVTGYRVFRGTAPGQTDLVLISFTTDLQAIDNSVQRGVRYYYTVAAVFDSGVAPKSNEVTGLLPSGGGGCQRADAILPPMHTNGNGVGYGLLEQTPENWEKLRQFFSDVPSFVPEPQLGIASVARLPDGTIVGGLMLQMVSYMGPFKIHPLYAGSVDYVQMKKLVDEQFLAKRKGHLIIPGYIVLTADERIARMAQHAGMTRKTDCITLVQEFGDTQIVA